MSYLAGTRPSELRKKRSTVILNLKDQVMQNKFVRTIDDDGSKIVKVQLRDQRFCILDEVDFDRLLNEDYSINWTCSGLTQGRVCLRIKSKPTYIPVAKIILNSPDFCWIGYLNNDKLDLRRKNLIQSEDRRPISLNK